MTFDMIINRIKRFLIRRNPQKYTDFLRKKGVKIGKNFRMFGSINIDLTRPSLVSIGDNVALNRNFTILTHDFVSGIFIHKYSEFIPSSGVKIGNNVQTGINVTVLKGVTIGDDCFIAAGALVTKSIPSGSIAAGVPAKVICSISDYFERRKMECISEAFAYVRSIKERYGREPVPEDFWEEFPLFVDKSNIADYPTIPIRRQLGDAFDVWLEQHKAPFKNLEEFLAAAKNADK